MSNNDTPAICGQALCGHTICGAISEPAQQFENFKRNSSKVGQSELNYSCGLAGSGGTK